MQLLDTRLLRVSGSELTWRLLKLRAKIVGLVVRFRV